MSGREFKESTRYCPETCPDVDRAFSDAETGIRGLLDELCTQIKLIGTEKLRDALCQAISDKNDAEEERDSLKDRVRELEAEVEYLERQLSSREAA